MYTVAQHILNVSVCDATSCSVKLKLYCIHEDFCPIIQFLVYMYIPLTAELYSFLTLHDSCHCQPFQHKQKYYLDFKCKTHLCKNDVNKYIRLAHV